jgi:hypothetical protein
MSSPKPEVTIREWLEATAKDMNKAETEDYTEYVHGILDGATEDQLVGVIVDAMGILQEMDLSRAIHVTIKIREVLREMVVEEIMSRNPLIKAVIAARNAREN